MNFGKAMAAACIALAAIAVWRMQPRIVDTHGATRWFVIGATLARVDDPVVVLGDSIVEASTLPRTLCGHTLVNAGIGGASTANDLGGMLIKALNDKRPALIAISLGTNDAALPATAATFRAQYETLLSKLRPAAARIAVIQIPLPEPGLGEGGKVSVDAVNDYNKVLPELAAENGAHFIPLAAMPPHHTFDGIHLNGAGYAAWDQSVLAGLSAAAC
jgi:lysophospholipase L1-like esterase